MRKAGHTVIEAQGEAEPAWTDHVRDFSNPALKSTTGSWYLGSNVPGKPAVFMPYLGGMPAYVEKCEDVVANGYEGFRFGAGWAQDGRTAPTIALRLTAQGPEDS